MLALIWTEPAMSDRVSIFDYIEPNSPSSAVAVDDRIVEQAEILRDFPEAGRIGRVSGTRELVIRCTPFVAVYSFDRREVRILRLLHGAQEWPSKN